MRVGAFPRYLFPLIKPLSVNHLPAMLIVSATNKMVTAILPITGLIPMITLNPSRKMIEIKVTAPCVCKIGTTFCKVL